jgi:hypothetical protein
VNENGADAGEKAGGSGNEAGEGDRAAGGQACGCEADGRRIRKIKPVSLAFGAIFIGFGVFFIVQEVQSGQTPWIGAIFCLYGIYRLLGGLGVLPDCGCGGG